ncbi:MAG: PD-(D/E)XK nuclease family protein [Elusimicrobia bacterium]|nr:PD-(D/E)XK nuclease family protein [Elusimicrobiota bacterium]
MRRQPAPEPSGDDAGPSLPGLGPAAGKDAPEPAAHLLADTSRKFSPSKLDTYRDCPRRYRFRYVDGLRRRVETVETLLGSCVHKALEELYAGLIHGREYTLEETLAVFDREWAAGWSDAVVNRRKEYGPEHHQAAGRDGVRAYFKAFAPFRQDTTVAVEKRLGFSMKVGDEEVRIEGLVDRLAKVAEGIYEVHDYKTTANLPGQAELDEDWQLAIYDIAIRENWPDAREVGLVWHFVRFGQTMRSLRAAEGRERLKGELAALILAIRHDHVFAPRRSALCDWCEYRDICPLWQPAPKEGAALAKEYALQEGKRRELRSKLHELEAGLREIEEDIVRYATAHGLESLCGPEGDVTISQKDDYHVPTRTSAPELYSRIEAMLKDTPIWRQAAHIDLHRLLQGYDRGEWDAAGMEAVRGVVSEFGAHIKRIRKAAVRWHHRKTEEPE